MLARFALLVLVASTSSCADGAPPPSGEPAAEATTAATTLAAGPTAAPAKRRVGKPELVLAPAGHEDAASVVARELERAKADERDLLVYVGATWCEPCQHFKQAVKRGALDDAFPGLRLLEFDADRDDLRLRRAGYLTKMIPFFAVPRDDGTAAPASEGKQLEGAIKGPGAVAWLTPRLRALLDEHTGKPQAAK